MGYTHLVARIDNLLEHSDSDLMEIFEGSTTCKDGAEIRVHLECRKAYGDVFLGNSNCEGFSPITGCPGHVDKPSIPTKMVLLLRELEAKKSSLKMFTVHSMAQKAAYQDAINLINDMYKDELGVYHG
ncbi:hypothetical protein [Pedobacter agri]|uniref:Uncharacterized protein n=1 Tax=Pedobacter agri TaxID=454586 RepID=A0A9X3DFB7_9SPHI|nr:hypothetical protein [Pedobacter agri]MCX3264783.1 hypothetical protein [Pedobacter agri]